jgi:hypothetical protein
MLAFIAPAVLALAACAGVDRINHVTYDGYAASHVVEAGRDGPAPLVVHGSPGGQPPLDVAAAAAHAMSGASFGPHIELAAAEGPNRNGYMVAIRFGSAGFPRSVCVEDPSAGADGVEYVAAFCKDGHPLSYLSGAVPDGDIAGAGFRRAMSGAAISLLPIENPNLYDCDLRDCD